MGVFDTFSALTASNTNAVSYEAERLREMGYKQVLNRGWRWFTNVAVTITAMSVLLSVSGSFSIGLTYGGPVVCLWGWIIVSIGVLCVALGMSELASAYPTSGGMYYWIFQLSGPKWGPLVCWVNGWLNLLGQIASVASTHYFMAYILTSIALLCTGTAALPAGSPPPDDDYTLGPGWEPTINQFFAIYTGCLLSSCLTNSLKFKHVSFYTELGAWFTIIGVVVVMVAIPIIATEKADAKWVFTAFDASVANDSGIKNNFYVFILGMLFPAFSFTGLDGPAHMSEESTNASLSAPWGIMLGVVFMIVFGFAWNISLLFCVSDFASVVGTGVYPPEAGRYNPVPQIFYNAFKQRTGSGTGGIIMLLIPLGGIIACCHSTLTYVARILFAYSRDKAVPLPWLWIKYCKTTESPLVAVYGIAFMAWLIALPMLGNETAFEAIISLSTIALNVAYVAPTVVRIMPWGARRFKPGPFNLGKWAYPIGITAWLWVSFVVVVFSLPTAYPVTSSNLNYAGVTLGCTLALSLIWFFFPYYGAYKWFKGPVPDVEGSDDGFVKVAPHHQEPDSDAEIVK